MVVWDRDGDTRHAVGLLGVMPVLLLVGEAGGLACWGVGVVFGNRIVDASIFACPCCRWLWLLWLVFLVAVAGLLCVVLGV